MDIKIYNIALSLIEQHGEEAIGFALRKTMRFVGKGWSLTIPAKRYRSGKKPIIS